MAHGAPNLFALAGPQSVQATNAQFLAMPGGARLGVAPPYVLLGAQGEPRTIKVLARLDHAMSCISGPACLFMQYADSRAKINPLIPRFSAQRLPTSLVCLSAGNNGAMASELGLQSCPLPHGGSTSAPFNQESMAMLSCEPVTAMQTGTAGALDFLTFESSAGSTQHVSKAGFLLHEPSLDGGMQQPSMWQAKHIGVLNPFSETSGDKLRDTSVSDEALAQLLLRVTGAHMLLSADHLQFTYAAVLHQPVNA